MAEGRCLKGDLAEPAVASKPRSKADALVKLAGKLVRGAGARGAVGRAAFLHVARVGLQDGEEGLGDREAHAGEARSVGVRGEGVIDSPLAEGPRSGVVRGQGDSTAGLACILDPGVAGVVA
jgi:hypothetical protein